MVGDADYAAHLKETAGTKSDKSVSTGVIPHFTIALTFFDQTTPCGSNLHAVNQAYTRDSKGYAVTGVVAVSCRHSFICPNGVVDLQKGEK